MKPTTQEVQLILKGDYFNTRMVKVQITQKKSTCKIGIFRTL